MYVIDCCTRNHIFYNHIIDSSFRLWIPLLLLKVRKKWRCYLRS